MGSIDRVKAEPGGGRDARQRGGRGFDQVQRHHAEASGMNQEIGGTQGVVGAAFAADPQDFFKQRSGRCGRAGIEGVRGIDERGAFASSSGSGQNGVG